MIFPLGHQSKLTMFLQNASISTNLISLSLLRLWKQERGFQGRHRDGALHHAVSSKGNTDRIDARSGSVFPWIRQAGYDTYLRGIKSRSGAEGQ